jgi:putative lipoic acid-binding regulatory protein
MEEFELVFPCEYPIRVIGLNEDDFQQYVMQVIARHVPGISMESFSSKNSRENNYISISVTFTAESRAQVTALYRELGSDPRVKVAL